MWWEADNEIQIHIQKRNPISVEIEMHISADVHVFHSMQWINGNWLHTAWCSEQALIDDKLLQKKCISKNISYTQRISHFSRNSFARTIFFPSFKSFEMCAMSIVLNSISQHMCDYFTVICAYPIYSSRVKAPKKTLICVRDMCNAP